MTALPKVQNAQYGDSAKLEQLGAGRMTNNPAASVQQWKDTAGGRPAETDPVKLATRAMQGASRQSGQLTPEQARFKQMFVSLADEHTAVQKWVKLANSPAAGPYTRAYAQAAIRAYAEHVKQVRAKTPFVNE